MTKYTKAKFLSEVGKRTEVFARFSTVGGEKGSPDAARDPRGFAVKFYTEEGNYDFVGNNTPVFFIRDPLKFPDFIHTQKRHPETNLKDADMFWDFLSLTPESVHQVTVLFSDRGTPATYRHMNGYSSHTYKWYNDKGGIRLGSSTTSRPTRASGTSPAPRPTSCPAMIRTTPPATCSRPSSAASIPPGLWRCRFSLRSRPGTSSGTSSTSPRSGPMGKCRPSPWASWCSTATR